MTPTPSAASRSESGTSASTSIVVRATSGSISTASANAPAYALWPWASTTRLKTKIPITIAGTPARTSSVRPTTLLIALRGELVHVDGDQDPERERHRSGEADDDERPDEGIREPLAPGGNNPTRLCDFVKRSRFSALAPCFATDQTTTPRIKTAIAAANQRAPPCPG